MFQIPGLPSQKSIFALLVERFLKAEALAEGKESGLPSRMKCKLMIMTSQDTHDETVSFFQANSFFGGCSENFYFFKQPVLPALDTYGKIIMKSPHELSLAPNGNGGVLDAIRLSPEVQQALEQVDFVQICGVDNVLNRLLDPLMVGYCSRNNL
mmetsp:Transcript_23068/g.35708  ORF Transcript_23068/g.35708 Transcript_23068/m.35708 type:complete len:154 (+) Transcript_23068:447-908(+)